MEKQAVHLFVFTTLSDWEASYVLPMLNDPAGRYFVCTVGVSREPVKTLGGVTILPDMTAGRLAFLLPLARLPLGRGPVNRAPVGTHLSCSEGRPVTAVRAQKPLWATHRAQSIGPLPMRHVGAALLVKIWCFFERLPLLTIVAKDDKRHVLTLG